MREHTKMTASKKPKSLKYLKRLYATIVVSILIFLVMQQLLVHVSISENKSFARHINLAGRQRMLSQKLMAHCLMYEMDTSYKNEVKEVMKNWNDGYYVLLHGNHKMGIDSPSDPVLFDNLQGIGTLHQKISGEVNHLLYDTIDKKRTNARIKQYEDLFMAGMEKIVKGYQQQAEQASDRITYIEYTMTLIALAIIMLEMFLVFRPTRRIIVGQEQQLEEKIKNLTDSIRYAKKVQDSILPGHRRLKSHLPQSFVLYLPKDIVAGDFYWTEALQLDITGLKWKNEVQPLHLSSSVTAPGKIPPIVLFAVADCTGHGVPGAMVSIVCHNAIEKVVREFGYVQPAQILDKVNELVRNTFTCGEHGVSDGMDISICCLNTATRQLDWAGANNPLWIVRKQAAETVMIELKPDKQPIGDHIVTKPFTHHSIELEKDDCIYLFSDGFSDQFGGNNGKKFTRMQMKKMLMEVSAIPEMSVQLTELKNRFMSWKKDMEQIDDVCVMGIKV